MASIVSIKSGLKTRLQTITGVTGYTESNPGSVNIPAAVIRRGPMTFDSTMARGSDELTFIVTLLVALAESKLANDLMDPYLAGSGALSVKAAVEGDKTLGGAAHTTRVTEASEDVEVTVGGTAYLGVDFTIEVIASGS